MCAENVTFEYKVNTCISSYHVNKKKHILEIGFHNKIWIFLLLKITRTVKKNKNINETNLV